MKSKSIMMFCSALVLSSYVYGSAEIDEYKKLANDTIKLVLTKKITPENVDDVIKTQEKLVNIGKQACTKFKGETQDATATKVMDLVLSNADSMQKMSLEEIEKQWHNGEFLKANGVDPDTVQHFGAANSHMDMIVHPVTAILVLNDYKKSKDAKKLDQVKDELSEVLKHLQHL